MQHLIQHSIALFSLLLLYLNTGRGRQGFRRRACYVPERTQFRLCHRRLHGQQDRNGIRPGERGTHDRTECERFYCRIRRRFPASAGGYVWGRGLHHFTEIRRKKPKPAVFIIGHLSGSSRKVRETNREEPNEHKEETVISVAISKALGNFNLVIESLKFTC